MTVDRIVAGVVASLALAIILVGVVRNWGLGWWVWAALGPMLGVRVWLGYRHRG